MKRLGTLIFAILINTLIGFADNIQFTASAPRVVEVGEQFEITFTINAQPSGFRPPEFKGLNLIGGPSQSSSSSIQFINGKVTQSVTFSYSYYFTANKPGTYTIEAAKATVDGKSYLSNTLTIEVVGGGKQGSSQGNVSSSQNKTDDNEEEVVAEAGNDDIFVRILVDKTTLYQGEHLIATIKLYSRLNISTIEKVDYPSFNGFFRQDIETPPLQRLEREVVNGQVYGTGIIQKMVLMPQKSGILIIDPFSLQAIVQVAVSRRPRSIWDDFWGPQVKEIRKKVESKPIKITVKPLPAQAPASFNGAVGNFTFKAVLDKQQVKTNDAVNLRITISGNGNLKLIQPFNIKFPTDFETYDPKVTLNTKASNNGIDGSKTFEYLIIPRHSGKFTIPAIEFSWFDTKSKQYKTASSGDLVLEVEKSDKDERTTVITGVDKEDIKFLGKDILFIKTKTPNLTIQGQYLISSLSYWLIYIIAFVLFIGIIIFLRNYIRSNADIKAVRTRKANKIATRRLREAHNYLKLNNLDLFYEHVLKAMWGYISDKLAIPTAELSRETIKELLAQHQIPENIIQKFLEIIDQCEFARYAPSQAAGQMQAVYENAIEVITQIEQSFKK